jgi:DNA-directed RNA polymerase subunit RPC12/RpoP
MRGIMNLTSAEGMEDHVRRLGNRCRKCGSRMYTNRNVFGMWTSTECPNCGYVID